MKVAELKGARNLTSIKCSCGSTWKLYGNIELDRKERRRFIKGHEQHDVSSFNVHSTVWRE